MAELRKSYPTTEKVTTFQYIDRGAGVRTGHLKSGRTRKVMAAIRKIEQLMKASKACKTTTR